MTPDPRHAEHSAASCHRLRSSEVGAEAPDTPNAAYSGAVRRLGRLRATPALRALRRETRLSPENFVQPLFVAERPEDAGPVPSMPGVRRLTLDELDAEAKRTAAAGVPAVILFGIPAHKDAAGSSAHDELGVVPRAINNIRRAAPDLAVITDVCLCQYTDHGHCAVATGDALDPDATLDALARTAVAHARAGADIVAPSASADGMVAAIRHALDHDGHPRTAVLSYAAKHASAFYGPFRHAAGSAPKFGDRRAHQLDSANAREAVEEALQDVREGADAVMVKPAGPALDIIRAVHDRNPGVPIAAYQVSGEYAMIHAAAERGWLDARAAAIESLLAIRRAGADFIITYFALDAAAWLRDADNQPS